MPANDTRSKTRTYSRRKFLTTAPAAIAGAVAFPSIARAPVLGLNGAVVPSNRIVMAGIGFGMEGPSNVRNFLDCVRGRALTVAPAEVAHRSASVGHLGVVTIGSMRAGLRSPAARELT